MTQCLARRIPICACGMVLGAFLCVPHPSVAVDHAPKWQGPNSLTYNLVDLDAYPPQSYGYCKWGNRIDGISTLSGGRLYFTVLTASPFNNDNKDLFLSDSQDSLFLVPFPANALWAAPPTLLDPKHGWISSPAFVPDLGLTLFRYLHFSPSLTALGSDGVERRLQASTRNLVILVHGWNPGSDPDGYGGEFARLSAELFNRLSGSDWTIMRYHWEADADTGPILTGNIFDNNAAINGTEAAEIAHQHGQHLGQLLFEAAPHLERVHFISHSAGSWVARSATRSLLESNSTLVVQITLLDPFMPKEAGTDSSLGRDVMKDLDAIPGNERLFRLENYYSVDVALGTQEQFDWRTGDTNLQVDWYDFSVPLGIHRYGDDPLFGQLGHGGPIEFYADTVVSTQPERALPPGLGPGASYTYSQVGWWRSMFERRLLFPSITAQPLDQNVSEGASATFTVSATSPRPLSYQWYKDGVPILGAVANAYTRGSLTAADSGEYYARLTNDFGPTFTRKARLSVVPANGPVITTQPEDQTVAEGQTATFTVVASGVGLQYQWQRNEIDISGETNPLYTTAPVRSSNDGFHYRARVSNDQGSVYSRTAMLFVTPSGNSTCGDPTEPNDGSLSATVLRAGDSTNALICTSTDVDWFCVTVTQAGTLVFSLSVPTGNDYDLELFGPDARYIKGSYRDVGLPETISHTAIIMGKYCVRVYGYPAGSGSHNSEETYTLGASFAPLTVSSSLSVTGKADIFLAGQPPGVSFAGCQNDEVPLNSPLEVGFDVSPLVGLAVQFTNVTGTVNGSIGCCSGVSATPDGRLSDIIGAGPAFGLSAVVAPAGSLVGVFLSAETPVDGDSVPVAMDFTGAARDVPVLYPALRQVFYIGRGRTSSGIFKNFVVPAGATRLFVGVLDYRGCSADNSGSFAVSLTVTNPPSPDRMTVFGIADIFLAGQPVGIDFVSCRQDHTPLNAPVDVELDLSGLSGKAVQFTNVMGTVSGSIGCCSGVSAAPDGRLSDIIGAGPAAGLSGIVAPAGSLVGVFLSSATPVDGDQVPVAMDFTGAARDVPVLYPALRQVFYIGRGRTSSGTFKNFVVPFWATRLFVGVLDYGGCSADNSGSFAVSLTVTNPPPVDPTTVFGIADIFLAGQPVGSAFTGCANDQVPLNEPVQPGLDVSGLVGLTVQFTNVTGTVSGSIGCCSGVSATPDGRTSDIIGTGPFFGLSGIFAPAGGLVGVFLADEVNPSAMLPRLDFSTQAQRDRATVTSLVQQVFYIGSGRTSLGAFKHFIVPQDATRLFLGVLDYGGCNADNAGWFSISAMGPPPLQPTLANIVAGSGQFSFSFQATGGKTYTVECKNSLTDASWRPLFSETSSGGVVTFSESVTNSPQRFYRLRVD